MLLFSIFFILSIIKSIICVLSVLVVDKFLNKFIDLNKVAEACSLGKSTVLLWESQGKSPQAVRLSKTKRVWLASDIDKWIEMMHKAKQLKMEIPYA